LLYVINGLRLSFGCAWIGVIGVLFERFVFQTIESVTVRRWGMISGSGV